LEIVENRTTEELPSDRDSAKSFWPIGSEVRATCRSGNQVASVNLYGSNSLSTARRHSLAVWAI
jgi:hypothetical protein